MASLKKGDPRTKEIASLGGKASKRTLPPDLKAAREEGRIAVEQMIWKHFDSSEDELRAISNDPANPALEKIICNIMLVAMTSADEKRTQFLLDRTIGKVIERVEAVHRADETMTRALTMSVNAIKKMIEAGPQARTVIDVRPTELTEKPKDP